MKVSQAIKELNYKPNVLARSLKTGESKQIGVINVSSIDPFFAEVLHGIENEAADNGFNILISNSENSKSRQLKQIEMMKQKGVDGLIINSWVVGNEMDSSLSGLDIPVVMLQFYNPDLALDYIHNDDYQAAYEAVSYLIGLGHKNIACIAGYAHHFHSAYLRTAGYKAALEDNQINIDESKIIVSWYRISDGYELFKRLYMNDNHISAVFCYSDLLAIGVIRAATDLGLKIPDDLSVMGFDDLELCPYIVPRLSTVFQEKTALGKKAFELIFSRINGDKTAPKRIILPSKLVIRESTGPVPGSS